MKMTLTQIIMIIERSSKEELMRVYQFIASEQNYLSLEELAEFHTHYTAQENIFWFESLPNLRVGNNTIPLSHLKKKYSGTKLMSNNQNTLPLSAFFL